jgi:hypothetical protein
MFFIKLTIQGAPIFHQLPTWHSPYFFTIFFGEIFLEKNLEICIFGVKKYFFSKDSPLS